MEYLQPKPLFETPGFYRNPTGLGQFGQLANDVKKESEELVLTTEYTKSESISGNIITFKKLKNKFTVTAVTFNDFGDEGISGVYIKGVITWSDNKQSSFSGVSNLTYDNGVITLEINTFTDRSPKYAILRISQL